MMDKPMPLPDRLENFARYLTDKKLERLPRRESMACFTIEELGPFIPDLLAAASELRRLSRTEDKSDAT